MICFPFSLDIPINCKWFFALPQSIGTSWRCPDDVPQNLSSCIICGLANVHIGPSGAEIGDDKETGGGRESGADA